MKENTTNEMWDLVDLIDLTEKWHVDRNLIDGATSTDQVLKLIQEVGELSDSVCKGEDVKDDIGDCLVILINIAKREGTTLEECLQVAYNDIKDRKGRMVDGIFISLCKERTWYESIRANNNLFRFLG